MEACLHFSGYNLNLEQPFKQPLRRSKELDRE